MANELFFQNCRNSGSTTADKKHTSNTTKQPESKAFTPNPHQQHHKWSGKAIIFFNANKYEWRVLNPILTSHPYFSLLWKPIHCNVSLSLQRILCKLLKMLLMSMNVPHELVTHKLSQKQQDKKKISESVSTTTF